MDRKGIGLRLRAGARSFGLRGWFPALLVTLGLSTSAPGAGTHPVAGPSEAPARCAPLGMADGVPTQEPAPEQAKDSGQDKVPAGESDATSKPAQDGFQLVPPGKRRAINGIGSVTGVSRVTFPSQPGIVQDLEATYAFPDRARWRMSPADPAAEGDAEKKGRGPRAQEQSKQRRKQRHQMFRYGNGSWTILPGKQTSIQHEEEELRIHLLRFEMRRLAFLYPGELEWAAEESTRRVVLDGVGTIEAQLNEAGLPTQIRSLDPDGSVREELKNIQWKTPAKEGDRREPASWDLHFQGTHVWSERFVSFKWGARLTESFFRPGDRFKGGGLRATGSSNSERFEIPEVAVWRVNIRPEGREDWAVALQQAREAMDEWRPKLAAEGFVLDEYPVFRLNQEGVPQRLELRLKTLPDFPPAGWFAQGGLEGMRRVGVGLEMANLKTVVNLMRGCPPKHVAMDPYLAVQLLENNEVGIAQLVVPISPR